MTNFSVVIPVYRSQATLPELHRRLVAALEPLAGSPGLAPMRDLHAAMILEQTGRAAEAGNLAAPGMLADYHAAARPAGQDHQAALLWAFIAGNNGQIARLRKPVEPAAQEEAARQAEAWLKKYRNKEPK